MRISPLARVSLFTSMDLCADLVRVMGCGYDPSNDRLIFRRLQIRYLPGLDSEAFEDLFDFWRDGYGVKPCGDITGNILRAAEEARRPDGSRLPFVCVCGQSPPEPFDADFWRAHRGCFARRRTKSAKTARSKRANGPAA